ncbi:MAG: hypothetical protein ACP5RX_00140 [Minisyncoccia bacterium]
MNPHQNILPRIFFFVKKGWFWILGEILLIIFVFSLGFIMGGKIINRPPIIIDKELIANLEETSNISSSMASSSSNLSNLYVASSKGKYYYPIDCPLVDNLSEKNKIYFSTKEEAESKGYILNHKCD